MKMAGAPVKLGSILSFCIVLYAVYFRKNDVGDVRLSSVKSHLLSLESKNGVGAGKSQPKVALGYGACYDLVINASSVLDCRDLKGEPQIYDEIDTMEELLKSFMYYFRHGAAAERFVTDSQLFESLVKKGEKSLGATWMTGGSAPQIAKRFHKEGWKTLLAAKMSDKLKSMYPKDLQIVGNEVNEEVKDAVHILMEYKANEKFGAYTAPRANRFIIHNDDSNPLLSSLEKFSEYLPGFNPDLFIVSGLQMMDNFPFKSEDGRDIKVERLDAVTKQILSLPLSTLIHFEMASYIDSELLHLFKSKLLPFIDSLGMNEQELANLHSILEFGKVSFIADSNPRIATALDQMRKIFLLIRQKGKEHNSKRQLTRIHVHTLAYQAILVVKNSDWKRTEAAVAKASLIAHRHVCNSQNIDLDRSKLLLDESFSTTAENSNNRVFFEETRAVACWDEMLDGESIEVCVAPVLVCTEAHVTGGAGDNISAAGLVLQVEK